MSLGTEELNLYFQLLKRVLKTDFLYCYLCITCFNAFIVNLFSSFGVLKKILLLNRITYSD